MKALLLALATSAALLLSPPAAAQLGKFLHGDAPAQPKAPPPKQLAVVSAAPGIAADPQVESFLRAFADALMARDGN
ncbi:hypothetical protein [Usitatibacter palustris]|uniref:Uncharacterized protein n=1 Tax=Usitatibacter palustris TaxID=2732487 RepID=A0A6M4H3C6_9PROT|nr:hypothetical protein [Usitatibacter palustris]QJR14079.1 hypothetical protein DSM104440_00872 [Usitatibacter palustris]